MSKPLTEPQMRMLRVLADLNDTCPGGTACQDGAHGDHCPQGRFKRPRAVNPRAVAKASWPDSPGWTKVTRKYGGHTGAMGGTMPMKAATVLHRLRTRGCATSEWDTNAWTITDLGRKVLDGTGQPR